MKLWQETNFTYIGRYLSALTLIGILSACGGSSGGSDDDDDDSNSSPTANAGSDQTVNELSTVTLAGSGSDSDGTIASYSWSQTSGTSVTLSDNTSASSSFTAPDISSDETLTFSLTVTDNNGASASDSVNITVSASASETTDITDAIFTNQSGNCEDYIGSYAANVTDIQRGLNFAGDVVISSDGSKCTFAVNEIPNHDFNDNSASFATNASEQNNSYQVDAAPVIASQATALSMGVTNVITLNGVVVDILAAACYDVGDEPLGEEKIGCGQDQIDNPWRYDPMSPLNGFGTDIHNAHTQPDGTYHYHGDPQAMYNTQDCATSGVISPVIGFAADGFPLYGPCINDNGSIRKATSSYALKDSGGPRQDVSGYTTPVGGVGDIDSDNYDGQFRGDYEYVEGGGDLDECNGMTVDGQYGYYVTDSYPWVLGCFSGTPDTSLQRIGLDLQNTLHRHD